MSDNGEVKLTSLVDSTYRINWEVTKEKFDNCNFPDSFFSPEFTIEINGEETEWCLEMHPRGDSELERNKVMVILRKTSEHEMYKVSFNAGIKTPTGYWPKDSVKSFYSRGSYDKGNYFGDADEEEVSEGWGYSIGTTEQFEKFFVENKVTVVVSFMIYVEGDKYRSHMEVSDQFVDNIRSVSTQENLADFTIISSDNKRFPCHRVILAVRSEYFEALFRNEPTKTELKVDEGPELVETMLEFMTKGRIPEDIDDNAIDLILMADMYGLDLLTVACETSLIDNLSPDNAVETLITIDKLKHVSKKEHRLKVLSYIKKEVHQIAKSKDWEKFVQNYPSLVTEVLLLKCSKKDGTCFSEQN